MEASPPTGPREESFGAFRDSLRNALILVGESADRVVLFPKDGAFGIVVTAAAPMDRLIATVVPGRGMPKEVDRPNTRARETWFFKARLYTTADLSDVLVTTMSVPEEADASGRVALRRFARLRNFPEWDHELLGFNYNGDWVYWLKHDEPVHAPTPVLAMATLMREHMRRTGRARDPPPQ